MCVNLCCDFLFKDSDLISYNECKFTREQSSKHLEFAVKDNHFIFNKQLFDQIDGVAMGSPLGLSLASMFMCVLEGTFLYNCPSDFKLLFIVIFIFDDTFCIFRNRQQVNKFLSYINSCRQNITLTAELGYDNKLPFLDTRNNNSFSTALIRKKTFTDLYYDFAAKLHMLTKLVLFVRSSFEHILSVPPILVFMMSFPVLKAFLKENHPLCLLLIGLLDPSRTTHLLVKVKSI